MNAARLCARHAARAPLLPFCTPSPSPSSRWRGWTAGLPHRCAAVAVRVAQQHFRCGRRRLRHRAPWRPRRRRFRRPLRWRATGFATDFSRRLGRPELPRTRARRAACAARRATAPPPSPPPSPPPPSPPPPPCGTSRRACAARVLVRTSARGGQRVQLGAQPRRRRRRRVYDVVHVNMDMHHNILYICTCTAHMHIHVLLCIHVVCRCAWCFSTLVVRICHKHMPCSAYTIDTVLEPSHGVQPYT